MQTTSTILCVFLATGSHASSCAELCTELCKAVQSSALPTFNSAGACKDGITVDVHGHHYGLWCCQQDETRQRRGISTGTASSEGSPTRRATQAPNKHSQLKSHQMSNCQPCSQHAHRRAQEPPHATAATPARSPAKRRAGHSANEASNEQTGTFKAAAGLHTYVHAAAGLRTSQNFRISPISREGTEHKQGRRRSRPRCRSTVSVQ